MNKAELIDDIAAQLEGAHTKRELETFVSAFTRAVEDALAAGEKVTLVGFGTFAARQRQARKATNLHTGESMIVPAKRAVVFSASKKLKDAVQ